MEVKRKDLFIFYLLLLPFYLRLYLFLFTSVNVIYYFQQMYYYVASYLSTINTRVFL